MPAPCGPAPWALPAGRATQVEAQKLRGEQALASEMALSLSREIAALAEPRLARTPGRRRRPPARGAARLLPGAALLPRRRLALPLHAVAAGRQDGDAGRCRRHRPGRHPRCRARRRAAGRQRRALCPRHHRQRALRGRPGRAGRGADRFGSLAARPDRGRGDPGGDREPLLLSHHDAAAGRGRDPGGPGRGPRRQQGAGGAGAHRGAALGVRRSPAAARHTRRA